MNEIIYTLVVTHLTIAAVTLYLHRSQAHRSVEFHPVIAHIMRFWLWLSTGMVTRQWVAIHRKHHRYTEQDGDPHSPHVHGIRTVLFRGWQLYHTASKDSAMVSQYGVGCPDDWLEKNVYSEHSRLGIVLMLLINLVLVGWWGLAIWIVQMIWIPLHAAGIINGLGHWWGYRNGATRDRSTNLVPWGIWIGGEELHANHHLNPASPRLSLKWWEFDIGWMYIRLLEMVSLAKVKRP